jgi:hypothetical protein
MRTSAGVGTRRLSFVVSSAIIGAVAAAFVAMLFLMRFRWAPAPGFSPAVVFWNERVPDAAAWWPRIFSLQALWSAALIALIATLLVVRSRSPELLARTLIGAQAAILGMFLLAPMPLDADQYAYVAYADLTNLGYSPYDPPLKREPLPRQMREVATVWSNSEGARDARDRVVIRDKYGPALTLLMAATLRPFRGASLETQARILRALAALACLAATILLWGELRGLPWGLAALAAFALNPLVITQTAIGAHDDLFALLPALAAYGLAVRARYLPAALALGLSAACKLTFAPFVLPLVAFVSLRTRRVAPALAAGGATAVVPLAFALPFGWWEALIRPYHDAQAYNASLLFAYVGAALRRTTHSPVLAEAVAHWAPVMAIVACTVLVAVLALRGRREPLLEIALLLLLFTAARQQTWYALNLTPALLIPRRWALAVFLGCSLASQLIQRKNFIGGWDQPPFIPFLIVAVVLSASLALWFRSLAGAANANPQPRPAVLRGTP